MATKKQKRLAGEARQAENREESRLIGLVALEKDRKRRATIKAKAEQKAEEERKEKERFKSAAVAMQKLALASLRTSESLGNFGEATAEQRQRINA